MNSTRLMLLLPLALLAGCKSPAPRPDLVDNRRYAPAAEQGNVIAQNQLGQAYQTHWRPTEANTWLHKAALQGQPDAMYTLGVNYLNGSGVQRNTTEAFAWFSIGASQDQLACRNAKQSLASRLTPAEVEVGNRRAAVLLAEIPPSGLIYKAPVSVKLKKEKPFKVENSAPVQAQKTVPATRVAPATKTKTTTKPVTVKGAAEELQPRK